MVECDVASSHTREEEIGYAGIGSFSSTCVKWTSEKNTGLFIDHFVPCSDLELWRLDDLALDRLLMVWSNEGIRNCAVSTMDLSMRLCVHTRNCSYPAEMKCMYGSLLTC